MISLHDVNKWYPSRSGLVHVLKDVNFTLNSGERIGIIGGNGAGKSTLIRLISGSELPTSGTIERRFSVSWPLAFTGAFQSTLTGMDNLKFICRVYGVKPETIEDFVEDFSELGAYMREPLRVYSSGMRARLAFALSMAFEFDCYLIDEVAAVGDLRFQQKCHVELFEKRGERAMIIVSHNEHYIREHCTMGALLDRGVLTVCDDVSDALRIHAKRTSLFEPSQHADPSFDSHFGYGPDQQLGANMFAVSDQYFRVPQELNRQQSGMKRWLVIGSCLASGLPDVMQELPDRVPGDYIVFNNIAELPASPPQPIEDYSLQFVQIALRSVIPDLAHARLNFSDVEAFEQLFANCVMRLEMLVRSAMKYNLQHGIMTIMPNFLVPQQASLGRVIPRYDLRNFSFFVEKLNEELYRMAAEYSDCHVLDLNGLAASLGKRYFQDDVLWQLNHGAALGDNDHAMDQGRLHVPRPVSAYFPIKSNEFVIAICAEIESIYRTAVGVDAVKLIIVDLDDTLWRGVLADLDTPELSNPEGWPLGVAEALLYARQRGIIIAIASKNSEERIRELWPHLWHGRLNIDDFAIIRVNWAPKPANVDEIIRLANVLPANTLFIDDNPVEREAVRQMFPDIRTLGEDLYNVRRTLMWAAELQLPQISTESAERGDMIRAQVKREQARSTMSRADFIRDLAIQFTQFTVDDDKHPRFARAFELLNKTNQFNTTGQRWQKEELRAMFDRGGRMFAFEAADRFTSYGLVGVAIVLDHNIVQFVMSCRVIGFDLELRSLEEIKAEYGGLTAEFVATEKNHICSDLFQRAGFTHDGSKWIHDGGSEQRSVNQ